MADNWQSEVNELKQTVAKLEARLQTQEDIEAIKKLQRSYGYYLERWEEHQLAGLFSKSEDVTIEINGSGEFKGQKELHELFSFEDHYTAFKGNKEAPPDYLHILIPTCGIVDVDPDGIHAKGRWYGSFKGALKRQGELRALIGCGIWENEYIKEDGVWKILRLMFSDIISTPLDMGWVKLPFMDNPVATKRPPSVRLKGWAPYPSGFKFPYHYKNPVTGK